MKVLLVEDFVYHQGVWYLWKDSVFDLIFNTSIKYLHIYKYDFLWKEIIG